MEDLIWFSFPGAIFFLPVAFIFPKPFDTDGALLIGLILVIGFIIHELSRLIFEISGGYARKSRKVLKEIKELAVRNIKLTICYNDAFLIWEYVIYSDKFSKDSRDHDRTFWHYIFSFWSICISSTLSLLVCIYGFVFIQQNVEFIKGIGLQLVLLIIFALKMHYSYKSLNEQEIFILKNNEELFLSPLKTMRDNNNLA